MKELTTDDKISLILKHELEITVAVLKGHKASEDDEFSERRKLLKNLRIELGIIKE